MGGAPFAWGVIELVVFTTLAPAAAVAHGVVAGRFLLRHAHDGSATPPHVALMAALAVVTLGFVVSATHLGNPSNALYVLTRVGRAGLSDEVLSCASFLALGGTFWVATLLWRLPRVVRNLWVVATEMALVAYLLCTASVYCMPTIPSWDTPWAQACVLLEALAGGSLLALALLSLAPARGEAALDARQARAFLVGSLVFGALACASLLAQHTATASMANAFGTVADRAPHYLASVALYAAGLVVACALVARGARGTREIDMPGARHRAYHRGRLLLVGGAALMYAVTFVVRLEFYATYLAA